MDKWQKTSLAGIGTTLLAFAGFAGTKGYNASAQIKSPIQVTVIGAVRRPGLITVQSGTIVQRAIELAGGSLPGADLANIDLGTPITSKAKIVVGDPTGMLSGAAESSSLEMSGAYPLIAETPGKRGSTKDSTPELLPGSININSASIQDFERLPKIGPVTALKIVQYRATIGQFTSIDQLDNVKGIGPKTLGLIRVYLTL